MSEESIQAKVAREDHDRSIRIEAIVNNMAVDLKSLADGSSIRMAALEKDVGDLKKVNDEAKPTILSLTVLEHDRMIRDFNTTVRNLKWVTGGSFMGLLAIIVYFTKVFGLVK